MESVARFRLATKPGGRAFLDRVYTSAERRWVSTDPLRLALCFTAKEAVAKALGTGLGLSHAATTNCQDIEIRWEPGQERPTATLRGRAAARAAALQLTNVAVCWHHTPWLACAVATATNAPVPLALLAAALREALGDRHEPTPVRP